MDKEPAELSDEKFVKKKTNDQIFRVIQKGGKGVKKSHLMPVFGSTLSEEEIWSLVAYIRVLADDDSHSVSLPENVNSNKPETIPIDSKTIQDFKIWFSENGNKPELIKQGEKLFRKKKSCFACHSIDDEGGKVGPDLTRAGFLYKPEWLFTWIKNPQFIKPTTKMPNIGLNDDEDKAITAFLAQLVVDPEEIPEAWSVYLESEGDSAKGKELFFDPDGKANCAKCHEVNKQGGKVGPNLSFLGNSRRPNFILESILIPKAVITVGYSSVLILTKEGKFLTGVKSNEDDLYLDITDKEGNLLHIPKDRIKKFKTQKISIMPGNFKDILNVEEIRNLLAFLETLTIPAIDSTNTAQINSNSTHH